MTLSSDSLSFAYEYSLSFADEYRAAREQRNGMSESVNAENREVLFPALASQGISTLVVDFNGGCDEGAIENISAYRPGEDDEIEISTTEVTVQVIEGWKEFLVKSQSVTLEEAIGIVCMEYLEQTAPEWETNEGAFGTFTFDVSEKTVKMDFNRRAVEETTWEF